METRRYAKRQMTWFRREQNVTWFQGFGDCPDVQKQVFEFVAAQVFLTGVVAERHACRSFPTRKSPVKKTESTDRIGHVFQRSSAARWQVVSHR